MVLTKIFLVITVILGSFFLAQIQAFKQPKCRGKDSKLSKQEMDVMTGCLKEFSPNSKGFGDMPKENMGCVGKCILTKEGLIDDKGMPLKENVFKMVNSTLDADAAQEADELVGKCIDDKASGIDPKEESCKSYWPLVECVTRAFIQVCMKKPGGANETSKAT